VRQKSAPAIVHARGIDGVPPITATLKPRTRAAWRDWLARHGEERQEIWVLRAKGEVPGSWPSYDDLVEEALCFGWIDGVVKRVDERFVAIRFTPRQPGSVWSEPNRRRVRSLLRTGLMTETGLARVREARENGQWAAAGKREEVSRIPRDLASALSRAGGHAAFADWPPSHRKLLLAWITEAKRPETRERRIAKVVDASRRGERLFG
jgi:uncharacterized protein YdeI (YjbR/CyaY-like superfamily)